MQPAISSRNPSAYVTTYEDPDTNMNRVLVVECLPSGVLGYNLFIPSVEGGSKELILSFEWPQNITNTGNKLFAKAISDGKLNIYHPKVVAVDKVMTDMKKNISDILSDEIIISLPVPVQSVGYTEEYCTFKDEDTNVTTVVVVVDLLAIDTSFVPVKKTTRIVKII